VTARDIYYYLTLFTLPLMVFSVLLVVARSGGNPFSALRDANVAEDNGIRTTGFFVIFWMVSYIMELQVVSKKNLGRVVLLFLVNLFYAFISMGKMNFMILFLASAIILTRRKILKLWHLAIGGVVMIFLFVGIQTIRGSYTTPKKFAALYLTSSMGNLNTNLKPESAEHWGENTFRLFYALKSALDGGHTKPVDPILEFKRVEVGEFVFGSPLCTEAVIHTVDGTDFKVVARNNSAENIYIQSVTLNGKPYDKFSISHSDIMKGGELVFEMGPEKKIN
jgi:oligosaccharide repeat unit polymerase